MKKQLKLYKFKAEPFITSGQFTTWNERRVRRHLRKMFGLKLYFEIRKTLIIQEAEGEDNHES